MNIEKVHAHIDSKQKEDLALLEKLVRYPSIASEGHSEDIRACAKEIMDYLNNMGFSTEIFETSTQPYIFAERKCNRADAKTILFYGHYDVQPAEPLAPWKTPPFEPTIINGRMYARGTADNKGQFLAHILAARSFLAVDGDLPVNVKFILDGEEENGSPSMEEMVRAHKDKLQADVVYFSDGPVQASGAPEIKHGFRGLYTFKIDIKTAEHENHSGRAGGLIPNAVILMSNLIASMVDSENHILIEGIYNNVVPANEYEKELIAKIPYNAEKLAKVYGVKEFKKTREEFYEQFNFLPTCTCDGMYGGYIGDGSKASVPNYAHAIFDIRLVADMDPEDVGRKVKAHVAKHCPIAVVTEHTMTPPSKTDPSMPICKTICAAAQKIFPNAVPIPSSAGTCSEYVWTKIAGIPAITVPYGNADQTNHAANENLDLEYYFKGIHCSAQVLNDLSAL